MKLTTLPLFLALALVASAQSPIPAGRTPASTPPASWTPDGVPVRTLQHRGKPLLKRWYIRLAVGAAAFAATYTVRRPTPRAQAIIITPGPTVITWRPCANPTCGGALASAPAPEVKP